jgi:hypothetical protein
VKKDTDEKLSVVTEWLHGQLIDRWNIEDPARWFRYVRRFMALLGFLGVCLSGIEGEHQHKPDAGKEIVDWLFSGATAGFALFIGTSFLFYVVFNWELSEHETESNQKNEMWMHIFFERFNKSISQKSTLPSGELFGAGSVASALLFVLALLIEAILTHL